MELRQLEAFVAVAEERNFTRAAARLYVAQSGLSATIRSLEKELQAPLFVRTTRRVDLTPAGAAFLSEARRTLASARAAAEVVEAVEGLQRGALTLGVMQASWLFDLAGLLARFRAAHPRIQLRLRQASSAEMVRLLDEGVLDLIFTTAADETSERVQTLPLVESPLVVVCARGDALDGRRTVRVHTIAERNQVGFPLGWGVRTQADRAMHAAGGEPRIDLEVNDSTTLLDLVEAGLGIAILPEAIAKLRPSLHRIGIHGQTWTWAIVAETVAPSPINPAARALWEMLISDRAS